MKTREILFKHAKRRAVERYEFEIDQNTFENFNHRIMEYSKNRIANGILFLKKESNRLVHYLIDDIYIVVFCKQRKAITTFLPPDAIHNYLTGSKYFENRKKWK